MKVKGVKKNTQDTLRLTKDMQAAVINGGGLPLMIATDQEGGLVARFGSGTFLPGNVPRFKIRYIWGNGAGRS